MTKLVGEQLPLPMSLPAKRRPIIIGLGQKARQGKTSASEAIAKHALAEKGFTRVLQIGFADGVYKVARDVFGMTEKDPPLLQKVGSFARDIDPDVWVKHLAKKVDETPQELIIIYDLRYQNEAAWVKSKGGGYCVEVKRYTADGKRLVAQDRDPNHISEVALDGYVFDYTVSAGPLADLQKSAIEVFEDILILEHGRDFPCDVCNPHLKEGV